MSAKKRLSLIALAFWVIGLGLRNTAYGQVQEAWVARYNGPANVADQASALAVGAGGNVYVTGASNNGSNGDYLTIKYDGSGNLVWEKRYNGPANRNDQATALRVDGSGNVYVTGASNNGSNDDYLTLKYDSVGNLVWEKRYNGPANSIDNAEALAVDSGGNVYVSGSSHNGSNWDYLTLKYDSVGNLVWEKRYNGPANSHDNAHALAVDSGGNVYVGGVSNNSSNNYDYLTLKYDAAGNQVWEKRYNGPANGNDYVYTLAVDSGGNVYVTGSSNNGGNDDYLTLKYDSVGNLVWEKRYNGPANGNDTATSLGVDGSGNAYVTGNSNNGGNNDYLTLKYDAAGNQVWEKRYNGPANSTDNATALGVDGSGNAYVTGHSNNGGNNDYLTLKYDAAGNQVWEKRYNGPANSTDNATALGVDGSGNVYVTGNSNNGGSNDDYATVKYTQQPQPVIASVTPTSGTIGATVTILGANFDLNPANNIVYFGATKATVVSASVTSLTVTVPVGATYGSITVTVGGKTTYSKMFFLPTFSSSIPTLDASTFAPNVDFTSGNGIFSSVVGDLDGDGKPDLATASYHTNTISVFRNTSVTGTIDGSSFAARVDFSAGTNPTTIAVGDLDGDGKLDLVVSNQASNTISVYRNTSTSGTLNAFSFAAGVSFGTGAGPYSVAIGDLDLDGKPDLAVADWATSGGNTVSVFRNTSQQGMIDNSSFASRVAFGTAANPFSVAIGDLDGDGRPELVTANNGTTTVSVLRNTSSIGVINGSSFASRVDFSIGSIPRMVKIGDLDGDGKLDLIAANQGSQTVSLLRNTSQLGIINASSFAPKADLSNGTAAFGVAVGDLDGDGNPDLAISNDDGGGAGHTVNLYHNATVAGVINAASFSPKVTLNTGSSPLCVSIGDLDGDGQSDLAVTNGGTNVSVFRHAGQLFGQGATFTEVGAAAGVNNNGSDYGAAWGDYDGDGDLDLYVANNAGASKLYRNNGNGTFTDVTATAGVTGTGVRASWGDYDNDGDLDLYVSNYGANLLYRNNGNGTFTDVAATAGVNDSGNGNGAAWGDYNNDGYLDLYLANNSGTNRLYRNNGNGTFTDVGSSAGVADAGAGRGVAWGDYDGDGDLDLYVVKENQANRLYRNNGSGTFTDVASTAGVNNNGTGEGAAWADYDNDGDLDLYVTNTNAQTNLLYRNNGSGTFTNVASSAGVADTGNGEDIAWGDYDNDGDLDLYVSRVTAPNRLYRNNGDGTFTDVAAAAGVNDGGNGEGVAWGDYDGDGDLDLYLANNSSANRLYKNAGNTNRWLAVKLVGTASNRDGIGARVTAVTGIIRQRRDVDGGSGRLSQPSLPVEFGFGGTTTVDQLTVQWPSGTSQTLTNVATNQVLTITEAGPPDLRVAGKIYFVSGDANVHTTDISAMNPDGTGLTRLTNNAQGNTAPSLSPDGAKVLFESIQSGNWKIYTMNPDGSGVVRVTNTPNSWAETYPTWSPDGTKIAFDSDQDGNREIYVMNADGTGATRLTNNSAIDTAPSWSPDGTKIAFTSWRDGSTSEVYVMNADGTGQTNLTHNSRDDAYPSWSPDGVKIAFSAFNGSGDDVFVMNAADGSGLTQLTNNPLEDYAPSWSPDGTMITFAGRQTGNYEIYVINTDGTGQTRLTNNSVGDAHPSWAQFRRIGAASVGGSVSRAMTIENRGTGPLTISNIASSDPQFVPSPASLTVAAGAVGTVTVAFTPTSAGVRYATLTISSDDPSSPSVKLMVNGTGNGGPVYAQSASSLAFGNVAVGASGTQTFTVSNTGTAALIVSSITVAGTDAAMFSANPTTFTINAGGPAQTVTVTFSPTSAGAKSASLSIAHNAAGSPATVSLDGTGTAPAYSQSASSLSFGNVAIGASGTQTFTVSNTGNATLSVGSITVTGTNASEFTVSPASFVILTGGAAQTVTVTFTPTSGGSKTASLSIAHNATGSPATVTLSGTGAAPVYSQSSNAMAFGSVNLGSSGTQTFTVSNTGSATLSVGSVTVTGANASEFTVNPASFAISTGGAAQTVTVTFTPTSSGSRTASLSVPHNAAGSPASVALSGTGAAPVYSQSASSLAFGNVVIGVSGTKTFTVSNTGNATLSVGSITVTGANASEFKASPASFAISAGGAAQTVTVTFTPTSSGSRTASLSIPHNAAGSPASVALSGTATIARQIALGLGRYPSVGGYLEVRNNALANYSHRSWPRVNWPWYNSNYGETRVAVGDIDGDGWDEIVVGLGSGSGGWIEVFDDVRSGYAHMAWLQVPWPWYNNVNGETRPAVGDLDGDGKAEIVVGLGKNGGGYFLILDDASKNFASKGFWRFNRSAYNNANGETRPAVGDVEGDGRAEIVLGFGPYSSDGGWMSVLSMNTTLTSATGRGWLRVPWGAYNSANGETWPAVGDVDGDGRAEIVAGLGTYKSNGGWMHIFDDATKGFASMSWWRVPWPAYNSANGETRPSVGDTDGDGKAEVAVGLGSSSGGWFPIFRGVDGSTATLSWNQIPWSAYNSAVGSSQPAIGRLAP